VSNQLAPRPSSALAEVPSRQELEALSPGDLWTLEERAVEITDLCRELNDQRLRDWIADGKTQTEIAQIVGRSTSSRRCIRLGLESASKRGRPRLSPGGISGTGNSSADEVIDAEVVEDDPRPRPASQPASSASEPQAPADPGPRVQCPTCGHMVKPNDIGAWQ
jgi:hypothetical protein